MRAEERRLDDWLDDLLTNAERIVAYTQRIDVKRFLADEPVRDLVIRKIENMGEAVRYVRELHPGFYDRVPLPWRDIRRMRNRLVHAYFDIDDLLLWETARDDVPALLAELRPLIDGSRGMQA